MCNSSRLLPFALVGCNAVFGLHDVDEARVYFDAPVDAPLTCPPIGSTPHFAPLVHQLVEQICIEYSTSRSGIAIALCAFGDTVRVAIGAAGSQLDEVVELPTLTYRTARLSPDGNRMLVLPTGVPPKLLERTTSGWRPPLDPAI